MESQSIYKAVHYVFDDEKEYKEYWLSKGIDAPPVIKDWRESKELDWVWSDDGRIVQILRRGKMKDTVRSPNKDLHSTAWVRTIVGTFVVSKAGKMDTEFFKGRDRYMFSKKLHSSKDSVLSRVKNTKRDRWFIYFIAIVRDQPAVAYMKVFETNNYASATIKAYVLLSQERIAVAIREEVKKIAKELEMDEKWHLEKIKSFVEDGDKDTTKLTALRLSGLWTGMEEKEEHVPPPQGEGLPIGSGDLQKRLEASNVSMKEIQNDE